MVGQELRDAFNKLNEDTGSHWHSLKELRTIIDKTETSIGTKLKRLLKFNHVACKKSTRPITYNRWDNGQEITANYPVILWRLV